MWAINEKYFSLLRGGGGELFTGFVDALIRTHGYVNGVGEADILTSLRVTISDGGVDTQVRCAMPADMTGFLQEPTCWQYKAKDYADISDDSLRKEIAKPYARQLIEQGYAYRFAICDDMPAEKQIGLEQLLTDCARQIYGNSPPALVLTASQLASWANQYPALLPAHFQSDPGPALFFDAWSRNITSVTPHFVSLEAWEGSASLIRDHIDFTKTVGAATLPLQGAAGVGKTRLVHEVVAKENAARHLVLYTADGDDAANIAGLLANSRQTKCILVADECPLTSRVTIANRLKGHTDRVRVICIDNSGERPIWGEAELRLTALEPASVEQVLAKNFPRVPQDRRRAYAQFSGGYIRFAADMCDHNAEIEAKGHVGPALSMAHDYYLGRFQDEEKRKVVEAISLVQKIGFGEGVSEELEALCSLTDQKPLRVLEIANSLKDSPGFVARTTRYLYITPEIIAQVAFQCAWRRWIEVDPDAFLRGIPASLLESFQARVARSGSQEVRTRTGQFFWRSVATLRPDALGDTDEMGKLAVLIETDPDQYFPQLAALVRNATPEDLKRSKGGIGQHGSRRTLVWSALSLASFPKYFAEAEYILRQLAMSETEEIIGNNATGVWKDLFRIQLSGVATPFTERMELLGKLLFSSEAAEAFLAFEALKETLNLTGTRLVGASIVAGQLVPTDWRPSTVGEYQQCLDLILNHFDQVFEHGTPDMQKIAWPTLAGRIRSLLSHGMLPTLKRIVDHHPVPSDDLPTLLIAVEDFLQYECRDESGGLRDDPYCHAADEWLRSITPDDFEGRVRAIIGKNSWHHTIRQDISKMSSEIEPLANELNGDPLKLEKVLPYLNSQAAASAGLLGVAMGQIDKNARHMDRIFEAASDSGSRALACGYASSVLLTNPESAQRLNLWIDRVEKTRPELAHFLALSTPKYSQPLTRAFKLIKAGHLPVQSLQNFMAGVLLDTMTAAEFNLLLELLVEAGDPESLHIAVDFVGHCVTFKRRFDATEREGIWRVLKQSAVVQDRADYWWVIAVEKFGIDAPEQACDVAILALAGDDHEKRNRAWEILSSLSRKANTELQGDLIMERVGVLLLNKEKGWRLQAGPRPGLFRALPAQSVRRWLDARGLEGARIIANYLAAPSVNDDGETEVHPLTEYVLEKWGEDKTVFNNFFASTHHLKLYTGDIGATHKSEADRARLFLFHPTPAIRKWAQTEVELGERQAREWAIEMEEQGL